MYTENVDHIDDEFVKHLISGLWAISVVLFITELLKILHYFFLSVALFFRTLGLTLPLL